MNHLVRQGLATFTCNTKLIVNLRNEGYRPPLFCIHHSGGDVGIYRKLATRLAPIRPVIGIQSRLEVGANEEFPTIQAMAATYARLIASQQKHGTIRLLGFSFGGFVATLIAEQLRLAGRTVGFLGLIDSCLGWVDADESSRSELTVRMLQLFKKFQSVGVMNLKPDRSMERDVAQLVDDCLGSDEILPSEIMAKTTAMGYVPSGEKYAELLGDFTFKFIAHCRLLRGFQPGAIRVPMHLWWPSEAEPSTSGNPQWSDTAGAKVTENTIRGSHYSVMRMPSVRTLAAQIDAVMEKVDLKFDHPGRTELDPWGPCYQPSLPTWV